MILRAVLLFVMGFGTLSCGSETPQVPSPSTSATTPPEQMRIVSFSPAMTETLFGLGAAEQVVGVTVYCNYPQAVVEAKEQGKIINVGGLVDPAIETVLKLQPTHIFSEKTTHSDKIDPLRKRGIEIVELRVESFKDILSMITRVGEITGHSDKADKALKAISQLLAEPIGEPRPRVLMIYHSASPSTVDGIGASSYQSEILTQLGALNVLADETFVTPIINAETILRHDPDLVIEIHYDDHASPVAERWQALSTLRAVKENNVVGLYGAKMVHPGVSIVYFIEALRAELMAWQARQKS